MEQTEYKMPPLDLLKTSNASEPVVDPLEQQANKERIINTLRCFDMEVETMYVYSTFRYRLI